ncbi:Predicted DHHC-type Zn-finger protein [Phaffia rhodozyma]|uniref:Palmitoyltransferase n=1 Tax=Phaffia rhodozyma TaxID=264483 RepID=A0A0F7STU5_PHARH|nr:Predicted DHHC-type Zn-finger protein [Phaffia rhodozyma]
MALDPDYYAGLPPITPPSYGMTPTHLANLKRRSKLKAFKTYAPIGLVICLMMYPYIPFVYLLCWCTTYGIENRPIYAIFQATIFHGLSGISLWSYYITWSTLPGSPPGVGGPTGEYALLDNHTRDEEREGEIGLTEFVRDGPTGRAMENDALGVMAKSSSGGPRFCRKCGVGKPDRCHHCSTCGRCILKMDHHCLWLGTCIGAKNYRSFVLFLVYTMLYCVFVAVESIQTLVGFVRESDAMTEFGFTFVSHFILIMMGTTFGLSIGGFACYHVYLALLNQTTLESMEISRTPPAVVLPDSPTQTSHLRWRPNHLLTRAERRPVSSSEVINPWDLGWRRNLQSLSPRSGSGSIKGLGWIFWVVRYLLPSEVGHDGIIFEVDRSKLDRLMDRTREIRLGQPSVSDGYPHGDNYGQGQGGRTRRSHGREYSRDGYMSKIENDRCNDDDEDDDIDDEVENDRTLGGNEGWNARPTATAPREGPV